MIAGKRSSIIDVLKSFSLLPYILRVDPQTCHKIKLEIADVDAQRMPRHKLKAPRKFHFCSHDALVKVKE